MAVRNGQTPSTVSGRHLSQATPASPRTGTISAPVNHVFGSPLASIIRVDEQTHMFPGQRATRQHSSPSVVINPTERMSPNKISMAPSQPETRARSRSRDTEASFKFSPRSPAATRRKSSSISSPRLGSSPVSKRFISDASEALAKARGQSAQKENDSMVYLDGPQIYTCGQCRTHLTSHDDIISKSFHGRHGRAYLFDQCVNITIGPAEDRLLITGLHSVCDIFCKRCKGMVGWTYAKAYESSQKYKEGKFIIEKINLHLEESGYYDVSHPAGERPDRWRLRSMSWGSDTGLPQSPRIEPIVYEYKVPSSISSLPNSPRCWGSSKSSSIRSVGGSPLIKPSSGLSSGPPPAPPFL